MSSMPEDVQGALKRQVGLLVMDGMPMLDACISAAPDELTFRGKISWGEKYLRSNQAYLERVWKEQALAF